MPPIDLKRQGQAEKHLASFYPETIEEKEAPFQTPIKNLKMKVQHVNINDTLKKYKFDLSGEDLECILIRAKLLAAMNNHLIITKADLEETVWDFNPLSYPHEIELQNLVAMLECTSREMLPKRFQNLERIRLVQDIQQLKILPESGSRHSVACSPQLPGLTSTISRCSQAPELSLSRRYSRMPSRSEPSSRVTT